jgi:hypothetical protein
MAPQGIIIGSDGKGNFKVRPEAGGRKVILSRSADSGFSIGQRVDYDDQSITHGDYVDFASIYQAMPGGLDARVAQPAARSVSAIRRESVTGRSSHPWDDFKGKKPLPRDAIERVLASADVTGVDALVVYDPVENAAGSDESFISIARNREGSEKAIDYIRGLVKHSGGGCTCPNHHIGSNGLYGQRYGLVIDFRPLVKDSPKQNRILFVPLEGLLSGQGYSRHYTFFRVEDETLRNCVECARLPPI